jgi:murein DD-endopeptidase MepM/ murein hydrolase activator NlpD
MTIDYPALAKRLFAERHFVLRSGDKIRSLALPGWVQVAGAAGMLALVIGIGGLAGAYHNLHKAIHRKEAEISIAANRAAALASLRDEVAKTDDLYLQMSDQFEEMKQQLDAANAGNETLRVATAAAEARVAALDRTRLALEQRLHGAEQTLAGKSGNVSQLARELAQSQGELHEAEQARGALQKKLADLQSDSATADTRTATLKEALALRERDLNTIAVERDRLRGQLKDQNVAAALPPATSRTYLGELEQLVASTGLDLDRVIGRLNSAPAGQGGPFVALDPLRAASDTERREALLGLVQTLPLAAPLEHYQLESGFGPRVDPINHRQAFHSGLDLAGAYRSPILATAPGTVTFTGVKDEYGKVVEITHAHGIVTRYAHLHRILVAPGQKVAVHQEIAELGSTGRSTGPHVHYEVLVDGVQLDPAKFLQAGKSVVQINASR